MKKGRNKQEQEQGPGFWETLSDRGKEVLGLISFCLGLVVFLSLVSHDPSDRFGFGSGRTVIINLIGPAGAAVSMALFKTIGMAAYLVSVGLLMLGVAGIRHREFRIQTVEGVSWLLLSLFTATFLATILIEKEILGVESGGLVGRYCSAGLVFIFSRVGSIIVLSALILLALLFATNLSIKAVALFSASAAAAVAKFVYKTGDSVLCKILPEKAVKKADDQSDDPVVFIPDKETGRPGSDEIKEPDEVVEEAETPVVEATAETTAPKERKKREKADKGPEVYSPPKQRKKRAEPADDRPVYDPEKGFTLPPSSLLPAGSHKDRTFDENALKENAKTLEAKLLTYGIEGKVQSIRPGPVITMYEFKPAPGIKVSKIVSLQNDLSMALAAIRVRIVAPIPGKDVVGIEVPNKDRDMVLLREVIESEAFSNPKIKLGMALGKDTEGTPVAVDLAKMPHLLVAGATGKGKSVSVNAMIMSLLFSHTPEEVRFIMVDPKMVELKVYEGIPHLLLPVVTSPKKAALALKWAVDEMNRRYQLLAYLEVREIAPYNVKVDKILKGEEKMPESLRIKMEETRQAVQTGIGTDGKNADAVEPFELQKLPYIVIVVDEFADLMMVAPRDVESSVARLAQMARAVGLHIILATQRPSTDVISGVIKANFPSRISFQVTTAIDSKVILDGYGAENLVGNGDMLFMGPGSSSLERIHGTYVDVNDISKVVEFLRQQGKPVYNEEILKPRASEGEEGSETEDDNGYDELYDQAVEIVCRERRASISYLQRKLQVGYNRAARMIEKMENEGVLSAPDSKGQREVIAPQI